jgi:hypothetical protein
VLPGKRGCVRLLKRTRCSLTQAPRHYYAHPCRFVGKSVMSTGLSRGFRDSSKCSNKAVFGQDALQRLYEQNFALKVYVLSFIPNCHSPSSRSFERLPSIEECALYPVPWKKRKKGWVISPNKCILDISTGKPQSSSAPHIWRAM